MKDVLEEVLESLNLSSKEASVYVALLRLGRGTVTHICRSANINRTSGYDVLGSLVSLGLARISGKEPKQEYVAESPDTLLELMKKRVEEARVRLEKVEKNLPRLKSMHRMEDRPQIKFYEGTDGLRQVYEDTLTSHESIRAFATVDDMHRGLPNYFPDYYKRRTERNIAIRAIVPKTEAGVERASHDVEEKREIAFVPAETYYFSPEINIYDNKIMIASWREKLGIIIESTEIADAMKKVYELAWVQAKRLDEALR
jgi:sugar-specific transcriptional regulator TrmB